MSKKNPRDRFGVPERLILEVLDEHRGIIRIGCYVPTREEVATADLAVLIPAISDWWWESPTQLIPTCSQVKDVIKILRSRPDASAPEVQSLIADAPFEGL